LYLFPLPPPSLGLAQIIDLASKSFETSFHSNGSPTLLAIRLHSTGNPEPRLNAFPPPLPTEVCGPRLPFPFFLFPAARTGKLAPRPAVKRTPGRHTLTSLPSVSDCMAALYRDRVGLHLPLFPPQFLDLAKSRSGSTKF